MNPLTSRHTIYEPHRGDGTADLCRTYGTLYTNVIVAGVSPLPKLTAPLRGLILPKLFPPLLYFRNLNYNLKLSRVNWQIKPRELANQAG